MKFLQNSQFKKAEAESFNNFEGDNYDDAEGFNDSSEYDPSENYDPNAGVNNFAGTPGSRKHGQSNKVMLKPLRKISASFDLKFANPTAEQITFEVFNVLNSFLKKLNTTYVVGTYTYIPHLTLQGIAAAGLGVVAFDQNGVLQITSTNNMLPNAALSCQQFPYSGLLESSGAQPFTIKRIRQKSVADPQIDNQITHFRSSFLGSTGSNVITPRQFFRPLQFQNTTVDIPVNFRIDSTKGISYVVNAGETVTWNITIERIVR